MNHRTEILKTLAQQNNLRPGLFLIEVDSAYWYVMLFPCHECLKITATDLSTQTTHEWQASGPLFSV